MGSFPETFIVPKVLGLLGLYLAITIKLQNCGNFRFQNSSRRYLQFYFPVFIFVFLFLRIGSSVAQNLVLNCDVIGWKNMSRFEN